MRKRAAALGAGFAAALAATFGAPARPAAREGARPDLVVVTIDTLRADAVGWSGESPPQTPSPTPHLDRFAAAGTVFPTARAHNVVTLPSHTNLLTGLYAYQHGVRDNAGFRVPADLPTLASVLHDAGYATGAFVAAAPLDSLYGLARGFDVYDDRYPKGRGRASVALPERPGDAVVAAALAWWRGAPRPRLLWVHLFEPHAPYDPPEALAARFGGNRYLGEVAAADQRLAPLLDELTAAPRGSLLLAVTADHGESLGEHGEETHGIFAYESTLRVPLLLWGAGVSARRDPRPARHVDLLPTLLGAAGLPLPAGRFDYAGNDLLGPAAPRPASYFEALSASLHRGWAPLTGVVRDERKLVSLPLAELYDLAADPRETSNRIDADRPLARELAALLPPAEVPRPASPAGGDEAERLAALGYLTGGAPARARYGPEDDPKNLRAIDRKIFALLEASDRGDRDAAIAIGRELVAARPAMALGRSLLAQALLDAGRGDEALAAMEAARAAGAASEGLTVQHGLTLAERGQAAEAVALLEPLAGRAEPRVLDALGLAYADAGRAADAERTLRRALELDAEDARAHQLLATIALRRADWRAANASALRAVELDAGSALAWNDLGVARWQLGEPDAALDAWARAVELDPTLWDALWNLGTRAAARGRTQVARRALERFVDAAPPARYAADIERARALLARLGSAR